MTEASHAYSIPRPPEIDIKEAHINKQKMLPGPGQYKINGKYEMGGEMKFAKSMLGGTTEE